MRSRLPVRARTGLGAQPVVPPAVDLPAPRDSLHTWGFVLGTIIVVAWGLSVAVGFQISLGILTALGFLVAAIGLFWSPTVGLLGIGILCALDPLTRTYLSGSLLRYNTLNYWLLLVMGVHLFFLLRLNNPIVRILEVLVLLMTLMLIVSTDKSEGMIDILNVGTTLGILVYFGKARRDDRALNTLAIITALTSALGGFVFYAQSAALPYINPNSFSLTPMTGLFAVCLGYHFHSKFSRNRLILLALALVNVVWIFFSGSRGSMLTAAPCVLYLFFASRNITWKATLLFMAAVVGGYFSLQFVEQQAMALHRLDRSFDPAATLDERTSGRSEIARAGLAVFARNPMGVGTGGFQDASGKVFILKEEGRPAHSGWVKVLVENGAVGFLLMGLFVVSFTFAGIKQRNMSYFLLGAMVTLVFATHLVSKEYQGKGQWFLAAGAIALLYSEDLKRARHPVIDETQARQRYRNWRGTRYAHRE